MSSKAVYTVSQFCLYHLRSSHCLVGQIACSVMLPKVRMNNLDQPTQIHISFAASPRFIASPVTELLAVITIVVIFEEFMNSYKALRRQ